MTGGKQNNFAVVLAAEKQQQEKVTTMKLTKHILTAVLLTDLAAGVLSARAADKTTGQKPRPYPLKT